MDTLLEFWRSLVGSAPEYVTNGNYSGSWDYGAMLEYAFAGIACLLVIVLIFKLLFKIIGLIGRKE